MRAQQTQRTRFEFYFADLDNPILVECLADGGVLIRAVRDNVSDQRKASFIRHLAAEGFIPDAHQWMRGALGVKWTIDHSWLTLPSVWRQRSGRLLFRLLLGSSVLWFLLTGAAMVVHHG